MKFIIQYVSRRRWQNDVDPEDQAWRSGEAFEGTEAEAEEHTSCLDQETDREFIHRAVPALKEAS